MTRRASGCVFFLFLIIIICVIEIILRIIFGVVLASLKLSFDPFTVSLGEFNVYGFAGAMVSNLAFAMRSILIKNMTADEANCKKKNLSSANVYAVGTAAPFLALTSLFLISLPNLPLLCQL